MRKLTDWFRHVYPPSWVLAIFFVSYGILYWIDLHERPSLTSMSFVAIASVAYGVFRAVYFHPAQRPAYRAWLETTPWVHTKPLPLGPIHLVWQDVVLIVALAVLVMHFIYVRLGEAGAATMPWSHLYLRFSSKWALYFVIVPFFAGYLLFMAMIFPNTAPLAFSGGVLFGLGLTARLILIPEAALAAILGTYLVAWLGLRRSLSDFPWSLHRPEQWSASLGENVLRSRTRQAPVIGWPYHQLSPRRIGALYSVWRATGACVLGGWWVHAILAHFRQIWEMTEHEPTEKFMSAIRWLALAAALGRILVYCGNHWSPITLFGRIATGRLIVPGYDRVFVGPLCVIVVGFALSALIPLTHAPVEWALPASAALILWLALTAGPSLEEWHLTGSHRLMRW